MALAELEQMRWDHKPTLFEDAERRVDELLEEYPDPADQGQLWFELTHIYGQSGGLPKRIVQCVKKTLEFPVEPQQEIRLYEYWAVALMADDSVPLPERRQAAAAVALDGLNALRKYDLPETPPALPDEMRLGFDEAREQARATQAMIQYGNDLSGFLVNAYAQRPFAATEELHESVMEKTNDPELADQLAAAVDKRVKASIAKFGPEGAHHAVGTPIPSPSKARMLVVAVNVLAIVVVAFLFWRRSVRRRGQAS